MPCGGFDTGANVWVENGEIFLYVDRSGSFDENNQMLKLGRFRIRFEEDIFAESFSQELVLEKGLVEICGKDTQITIWFDAFAPCGHIEIRSQKKQEVTIWYESWRTAERELIYGEIGTGERQAAASYVCYPGTVITYPDVIEQGTDHVIFYHRNRNEKLLFDFLVEQQKLQEIKDKMDNPQKDLIFGGKLSGDHCECVENIRGEYAGIPFEGFGLKSARGKEHSFFLCFHDGQQENAEDWRRELEEKEVRNRKRAHEETLEWWENFWKRSYITINPDRGAEDPGYQMARNYTLFRYMLGCNAYGKYPTKFNGGLFTTDACYSIGEGHTFYSGSNHAGKTPDFRMWGGGSFTAQNQRLVYWPMLKSGDFDMMPSQFDFYNRLLGNAELRTEAYWKHKGCSFTEQLENIGLPIGWTYGYEDCRWKVFRRPADFDHRELICPSTRYLYSAQLEFAYMIIQYYRYSGLDIAEYIPFIESCVAFYFEHYPLEKNETGEKLVIFPSTGLESYKNALNPADAVAALTALAGELSALPEYVNAAHYAELLTKVPELKTGMVEGEEAILPAWSWSHIHNCELPQLYPVFPYPLYGIGKENVELAIRTWRTAPDSQKNHISWHQDGIFTARLGLTEEAVQINQKKLMDSGRRFPAFWGPGHDWVPDFNWGGSGMIGLQDMLVQQYGKKVYLLPAWPEDWDVRFRLHLPDRAILECSYEGGKLEWEFVEGFHGQEVVGKSVG